MLVIKYYKNWFIKQKESETLLQENAKAELQLLKAQVHPHFLFNTLNNIYSYTLTGNPYAADLVEKLSGIIDYMCTDGFKTLVPLEKEIQLIKDYVELEKVRYGSRLTIKMDIKGDFDDKYIAPLLMIPFVENSFKHGASRLRGDQWIDMSIHVRNNLLDFHLANSKQNEETIPVREGIGLVNVQKRLRLLYPSHHIFHCDSNDTTYAVELQVLLSETGTVNENNLSIQYQPVLYA